MPDTAVAPEITAAKVLTATEHAVEAPKFTGSLTDQQNELTEGAREAQRIRELKGKDPNNLKSTLIKTAAPPEFTEAMLTETTAAIGKNLVNVIEPELVNFAKYLEASRRAQMNGTDITTELGSNAATVKELVAKTLIARGRLLEKFPVLEGAFENNSAGLQSFVEEYVARDPRFQLEIAKTLAEIHTDTKSKIESTADNPETVRKEAMKASIEKRTAAQFETIKTALTGMSLDTTAIDRIKENMDAGLSQKSILLQIEDELIKANGLGDNYFSLHDYSINLSRVDEINSVLAQKQQEKTSLEGVQRGRDTQRIDTLGREIAKLETDAPRAEAQAVAVRESLITPAYVASQFDADFIKFNKIQGMVGGDSATSSYVKDYLENYLKVNELDAEIKAMKPPKTPETLAQEQKDKEDLARRLEAVIDTSMSNFLDKKYTDYESSQKILIDASIKEAEKSNKKWKAEGLKQIRKEKEGWSTFVDGKYTRNPDVVFNRIREVADLSANGKDAKRVILGELTGFSISLEEMRNRIAGELATGKKYSELNSNQQKSVDASVENRRESYLKDTVASQIRGASVLYENLLPEEKATADKIVEDKTRDFEEIVAEQGESFMEGLFIEYSATRGFKDKIERGKFGSGSYSLTNDEVDVLNREFGPIMDSTLENSSLYKKLKEQGVIKNHKTKWLLFLAIILGLGVAAVSLAPAAVAVGAAAKGVGNAAWS